MSAPYIIACANFPSAIFPFWNHYIRFNASLLWHTQQLAALVFPVEAQTIALAPSSTAFCYSHHHPAIFE